MLLYDFLKQGLHSLQVHPGLQRARSTDCMLFMNDPSNYPADGLIDTQLPVQKTTVIGSRRHILQTMVGRLREISGSDAC